MFIKTNERKERILCIISYRWKRDCDFKIYASTWNSWEFLKFLLSSLSFAKNSVENKTCDSFILKYSIGSSFLPSSCLHVIYMKNKNFYRDIYFFTTMMKISFFYTCNSRLEFFKLIFLFAYLYYINNFPIYLETCKLCTIRKESFYICNNVIE